MESKSEWSNTRHIIGAEPGRADEWGGDRSRADSWGNYFGTLARASRSNSWYILSWLVRMSASWRDKYVGAWVREMSRTPRDWPDLKVGYTHTHETSCWGTRASGTFCFFQNICLSANSLLYKLQPWPLPRVVWNSTADSIIRSFCHNSESTIKNHQTFKKTVKRSPQIWVAKQFIPEKSSECYKWIVNP